MQICLKPSIIYKWPLESEVDFLNSNTEVDQPFYQISSRLALIMEYVDEVQNV